MLKEGRGYSFEREESDVDRSIDIDRIRIVYLIQIDGNATHLLDILQSLCFVISYKDVCSSQ